MFDKIKWAREQIEKGERQRAEWQKSLEESRKSRKQEAEKYYSKMLSVIEYTNYEVEIPDLKSVSVSVIDENRILTITIKLHEQELLDIMHHSYECQDIFEAIQKSNARNISALKNQLVDELESRRFCNIRQEHFLDKTNLTLNIGKINRVDKSEHKYQIKIHVYDRTVYRQDTTDYQDDNLNPNDFDSMDGYQFENFCAALLTKRGYEDVVVTQGSGDQGIDILAYKDGIKYGVQCKCYSSAVGNKAVQEVFAGKTFYHCHVGIVITNNYFTESAIELAKMNGVILWDRKKLIEMIEKTK